MKIQIEKNEKIEKAKVLSAHGGYVSIVFHGKVVEQYNPALAKKYNKWRKKQKRNPLQKLPEDIRPRKVNAKDYTVSRGDISNHQCDSGDCASCLLSVSLECSGGGPCDFYKPSPRNVKYYA